MGNGGEGSDKVRNGGAITGNDVKFGGADDVDL